MLHFKSHPLDKLEDKFFFKRENDVGCYFTILQFYLLGIFYFETRDRMFIVKRFFRQKAC